jgi:hypothetical protein
MYAFGSMRREPLIRGDPRFAIPEGCRHLFSASGSVGDV